MYYNRIGACNSIIGFKDRLDKSVWWRIPLINYYTVLSKYCCIIIQLPIHFGVIFLVRYTIGNVTSVI